MAQNEKSSPVVNIDDLEYKPLSHGDKFDARMGDLGTRLGAQKLGYNITIVPPGKRAWPRHNHVVNEEMFLILEGSGEVRIGDATYPIKKGDVIANPAGGRNTAHQIVNTSKAELKYLALSTRQMPELVEYPDSDKTGIMAQVPGADGKPQLKRFLARKEATFEEYWEGE
jgi:uncharacterized cupin superfamily protein